MRLAIVEDEKIHQDYLLAMLEKAAKELDISISNNLFESAESFLFEYEDTKFDAILLDINLNDVSGFSLAKLIRKQDSQIPIAFVTGKRDYVFDGYRIDACGYILKPLKQEDISLLLNKIYHKVSLTKSSINIKSNNRLINLYEDEIYFIESDNHNTKLCTKKGEFVTSNKLKQWVKLLSRGSFFRPHRSYLVNLYHIERIDKKNVLIKSGTQIPIARGKWEGLMKAYLDYRRKDYN